MTDRFPPVRFNSALVPFDSPQYIPGSAAAQRQASAVLDRTAPVWGPGGAVGDGIEPGSGAGNMPTVSQDPTLHDPVPIRNVAGLASVFSQAPNVAQVSAKFLDQPPTKRNLLMMRNASAAANIYIEFGKDATANSIIRLTPNTMILFDTVVPQDDLYAIADAAGAVLAFGYSTIL